MKSSKVSSKKRVVFVCAGVGVLLAGLCIGLKALWPLSSSAPIYLLPHEDAKLVSPGTDVVIRAAVKLGAWNVTPALFKVVGDKSGAVAGEAILSDDDKTMLFKPAKPFTPGEAVTVDFVGGKLGAGGEKINPVRFSFVVSPKAYPYVAPGLTITPALPPPPGPVQTYQTAPGTVPFISITNNLKTPDPNQYIFLSPSMSTASPYLMILDSVGGLVYYRRLDPAYVYDDFKPLPDGTLSYFQGWGDNTGGQGFRVAMDSSYNKTEIINGGNGYLIDPHEFLQLPDGHTVATIYDNQPVDLTTRGGPADATFIDFIVQEKDQAGNVVFEWHATKDIPFEDSWEPITGTLIDPYHGNSIQLLPDDNYLVSLRHTSQLIKVNRQTGAVMWKMGGGKDSDFAYADGDPGFVYQHDARWHEGNYLTVFDNGNIHPPPKYSRAVEYAVDEAKKTLTKVWEYRHAPDDIYGFFMGNATREANGNTFIGWGGPRSIATEVTPAGEKLLEMEVGAPGGFVYRWNIGTWMGSPDTPPALVARTNASATTLYYSWNGATEVSAYRVEGGVSPDKLTNLMVTPKKGFETATELSGGAPAGCYYRIVPIDKQGKDMRASDVVKLATPECE
ncbi:MAG TPA: aryl-sulfate sulfotransferase [Thermoflexales bacterium]|nr:aryl-sulfate sulfotransferase [Thermoflexales bacterium]